MLAFYVAMAFGLVPETHSDVRAYERIWDARVSRQEVRVPQDGLTWRWDCASFKLESGSIRLAKPDGDWSPIVVFSGKGRARVSVDDPIERRHFERVSESKLTKGAVELTFEHMVLEQSMSFFPQQLQLPREATFEPDPMVVERMEQVLRAGLRDVPSELMRARTIEGDAYCVAWLETASFGWLMIEFDRLGAEEITLSTIRSGIATTHYPEVWLSLDQDRDSGGRPRSLYRFPVSLPHFEIGAEIKGTKHGLQQMDEYDAEFKVTATVVSLQAGLGALPLALRSDAEVKSVRGPDGANLAFIRRHVGGEFVTVESKYYDTGLLVFLAEPLEKGEQTRVTFDYEIRLPNFASGRSWYPARKNQPLLDPHTGVMAFEIGQKFDVRASGSALEDGLKWVVEKPAKMLGFSYGRKFKEESLQVDGVPPVTVFGIRRSVGTGNQLRNVGADIVNSLNYYQILFDVKLPSEHLWVTRIEAFHGQSFEGYIHLSGSTFNAEQPGRSELFRAHEAAHQYWGHLLGWRSYRDQWLSESLAEYSAMMFVEETMRKEDYFHEILDAYTKSIFGEISGSKFWKFSQAQWPDDLKTRIGAIGMGYRASNADLPLGYQTQVYTKGPLVLHMMRMLMHNMTGDPFAFHKCLRDFVKAGQGSSVTTENFRSVVEAHTGQDWSRFFDQWIYGSELPRLKCRQQVTATSDGFQIDMEIEQAGVGPGFQTLLPVDLIFKDGTRSRVLIAVQGSGTKKRLTLEKRPKDIDFNPEYSVLAKME